MNPIRKDRQRGAGLAASKPKAKTGAGSNVNPQYYSAKRRFAATLLCVAASQSKEHESAFHNPQLNMRITRSILIEEGELEFRFIHASGPGGQNVNKVATACQLRFNVADSSSLPEEVKQRLIRLAGRRMTQRGVLVIDARRYRTQPRNRQDALERFVKLVQRAAASPKPRRETKPTLASKKRRLESKQHRSRTKQLRQPPKQD
jgi:ribosome-associated protein